MGTLIFTPGPFTQNGANFTTSRALTMNGAVTMTGGLTLNSLTLNGPLTSTNQITTGAITASSITTSGASTVAGLTSTASISLPLNTWLMSNGQNLFQLTGSTLAIQGGYNNVQIQTTSGTPIVTYTNSLITYAQPLLASGNLKLPPSGVLFGQVSGGADVSVLTWDSSGNTTLRVKSGQSFLVQDSTSASLATLTTSGATLPGTLQVSGATTLMSTLTLSAGLVQTTQSGAANGLSYRVWNGSSAVVPWSVGGQFNSAPAYVDTSGNLTALKVTLSNGALSFTNTLSTANKVIDLQQNYGIYSDNTGSGPDGTRVWLNGTNGGEVLIGPRTGGNFLSDLTVITNQIVLKDSNGNRLDTSNSIISGGTYFGFKDKNLAKLAEMKAGGNLLINGTYQTVGTTTTITGSQSFDSFDYAECFPFNQDYPNGTIVCLQESGVMSRCTHPGCPRAQIVSLHPGYMTGNPDEDDPADHVQPVALMGRVKVPCTSLCHLGNFVYSAGDGTVTTIPTVSSPFALGYCISLPDQDGVIGIMVRPGIFS